ncbi:MAG: DUF1707 and DUF2154 domain-containing protein [Pseudomonadales bacterium]|nr:DUF1707 and DUF2154 domain-containing protein [Pseudomonadales bacterium]
MPVESRDRPIDVVREEVIDQLIVNYSHAKLSLEAFERRLDDALASDDAEELSELVADLEFNVDERYADQKREELDLDYDYGAQRDVEYAFNIFGGSNRRGPWSVPKEIRILNLFGGGEIDFTDAKFTHPTVRIRMLTLFGGATIYVREDINTVSKIIAIFGGNDNRAPSTRGGRGPVVIVEGLVMFGGTTIKIRRTAKEIFLDFADRIRGIRRPTSNRSSEQEPWSQMYLSPYIS